MDACCGTRDTPSMRGFVALAVTAAAVVLAGCGGQAARESEPPDGREAAQSSDSTVAVTDGFRLRRVPEAGLQLALPRGWIGLARRDAAFPGTMQTLSRIDRSVSGAIAMLAQPDSPLRLLALVPPAAAGQKFAGSVSLVVTAAPPVRRSGAGSRTWYARCARTRPCAAASTSGPSGSASATASGSRSSACGAASASRRCRSRRSTATG